MHRDRLKNKLLTLPGDLLTHAPKDGFTLVELLVSMGVFILFLAFVSSSYITIVRAQRSANEVRKTYSEVRDFFEVFSQEVRLGTIDYPCYEGTTADACVVQDVAYSLQSGRSNYLALVSKDGSEKNVFHFNKDLHTVELQKFVLKGTSFVPAPGYIDGFRHLFSDQVQVDELSFVISPIVNPYDQKHAAENKYQFQPKVTLFLTVRSGSGQTKVAPLHLQTTVSSRAYSRSTR